MRVTLNQDELFGAITEHLRDKLNLSDTASIEISFTAGRSPKGYTADVDITYPASELAAKCSAKPHDDQVVESYGNVGDAAVAAAAATSAEPMVLAGDPTAAASASAVKLFED